MSQVQSIKLSQIVPFNSPGAPQNVCVCVCQTVHQVTWMAIYALSSVHARHMVHETCMWCTYVYSPGCTMPWVSMRAVGVYRDTEASVTLETKIVRMKMIGNVLWPESIADFRHFWSSFWPSTSSRAKKKTLKMHQMSKYLDKHLEK